METSFGNKLYWENCNAGSAAKKKVAALNKLKTETETTANE